MNKARWVEEDAEGRVAREKQAAWKHNSSPVQPSTVQHTARESKKQLTWKVFWVSIDKDVALLVFVDLPSV